MGSQIIIPRLLLQISSKSIFANRLLAKILINTVRIASCQFAKLLQ